jgi:hypothetical protein
MPGYNIAGSWDYMDADSKAHVINSASDDDLAKTRSCSVASP